MRRLVLILILVIPLFGSWKDLSLPERKAWVVRHFGEMELKRIERLNLLEDDWLFEGRQPESLNVRIVGRWPFGPTFEVTGDTIRELVFQGSGSGVRILDISNMPNVQELATIAAPYAGLIRGLAVKDTVLVVLQGADGFTIYGTANASNPGELSRMFIGQWLNDCFIKDSLLFIAGDDSLRIFNLKDPASPQWLGGTPVTALGIYVQGNYAYLVYQGYLRIYDISDPTNPTQMGIWSTTVDCQTVWVSDTVAYIGTYNDGLQIINVKNVASPFKITDYPCGDTRGLFMVEDPIKFLYLPDHDDLRILDVSDPANPQLVDSVQTPGWAVDVWANRETGPGAYIFVGDHFEGIGVYDTEQPSDIQWLYQYGEAEIARDVVVQGNYLYLAERRSGVKIIDISNPQDPQEIASIRDTVHYVADFKAIGVQDTILFTINDFGIFMAFSVSDPVNPYLIDSMNIMGYGNGSIVFSDSVAFTADAAVLAVNISDPTQIDTFRSYLLPPGGGNDIGAIDSLVFVAFSGNGHGLRIINYADPWNPYELGYLPTSSECYGICLSDTICYIDDRDYGIRAISVANPGNPYQVGFYPLPSFGTGFAIAGDTLFNSQGGLRVLNVSDSANMSEIGYYQWGYYTGQLWTDGSYIYCARSQAGMTIMEFYGSSVEESQYQTLSHIRIPSVVHGDILLVSGLRKKAKLKIYDALGRVALNRDLTSQDTNLRLTGLKSGVYFLSLEGEISKVHKFVLLK